MGSRKDTQGNHGRMAATHDPSDPLRPKAIERLKGRFGSLKAGRSKNARGPVAWCSQCSRFHPRRAVCALSLRDRTIVRRDGSQVTVKRWAH